MSADQTWQSVSLEAVAQIVNGGTPRSDVAEYWDGDVQWLTPKDMGQMRSREIASTPRTLTQAGLQNSSARQVPENSIILSTRAPIGHLAINKQPMAFNQGCRGIVPGDHLDHHFLYYFLLANRTELDELGTGATFKELSTGALRSFEIPLPPLDEQTRIVAKLDQAFVALDRARANAEANLEAAAKLPETWLQELFEGSEAWPTHTLADLCENLDRLRVPITKSDREPGDIPYYGASGVVDHVKGHLFDEDLLLVSEDGANLLARTYPIAFSISGKAWVNNHAHVLRFSDSTTQEFVRLYLNSISLKPYVTGMAQPKLNQAALNGIPVPMPAVDVRAEIVRKAHQISAEAARAADNYIAQSADIAALRQSMLQAAFSGQLT
ncbi:restriction endonuclease subunit S [Pseudoxanthomonas mexicana]|uniref:restriction endonuclease subunit S n=1 Tax=Pseudoxanthomonas mexicana TaxID=128785 RepID=UPI0022F3A433|nr:restriction endonuclease subunit S [Pseudoxanthomonas mexicana]WBX93729.1 restriction endonuclease subunit S [Pseudoxanthomonas mexicana]